MEIEEFKEEIEEFVSEHFTTDGCRECHEVGHDIVPDNFKGSYNRAIKQLYLAVFGYVDEAIEQRADLKRKYGDD